jgi:acyl-CoA thioester hydrolase
MPLATPLIEYGKLLPVQVYYDDLDVMGLLHHARYAMLLDRAIGGYWTARGYTLSDSNGSPDVFNAVRELAIEYSAPVTRPGELLIHLWLNRLGRTSAEYGFRLLSPDGGTVYARGRRAVVKLDPATLRPAPWTDRVRVDAAELLRPDGLDTRAAGA